MFGFRMPSLRRSLSMRFSLRSIIAHRLGGKMPKGTGGLRDPSRAAYNAVYSRTTVAPGELIDKKKDK